MYTYRYMYTYICVYICTCKIWLPVKEPKYHLMDTTQGP